MLGDFERKTKKLNYISVMSTDDIWKLAFKTKANTKHQQLKIRPEKCNWMLSRRIKQVPLATYN